EIARSASVTSASFSRAAGLIPADPSAIKSTIKFSCTSEIVLISDLPRADTEPARDAPSTGVEGNCHRYLGGAGEILSRRTAGFRRDSELVERLARQRLERLSRDGPS